MKKLNIRKGMDKVNGFIVKYRIVVLCIVLAIIGLSVYGLTLTNINSDIMSYLPEGTDTYDGSEFFKKNFNLQSNAAYAVKGSTISYDDLSQAVKEIETNKYISGVKWLGSFDSIKYGSLKIEDPLGKMEGGDASKQKLRDTFYKEDANGERNYMLIVTLNVGASADEAGEALAFINKTLDDAGATYVSGGTAPNSRKVYDDAIAELPIYLAVGIFLMLIVLFLVSTNWLEPIIFMLIMGISVLVNMGTNFVFGEISIITFCAASILQLALAMDYSIFLTQIYREKISKGQPYMSAMIDAIGTTTNTVMASALTTMGGFAAFFVMSFTLGADLGGVLLKGIAMAMLTVVIVQPCLMLVLRKPMVKCEHKRLINFKFRRMAKFSVNHRIWIIVIFALLLVPTFIGQLKLPLSYLNFIPDVEGDPALCAYVDETSNQVLLAVPVDATDTARNINFVKKLEDLPEVSMVTGFYAFIPEEAVTSSGVEVKVGNTPLTITNEDFYNLAKKSGLVSKRNYTMYMVSLASGTGVETESAMNALAKIRQVTDDEFTERYYCTGVVQAVSDFKEITPRDFKWITILSVAIIFIVLVISLRSIIYPILLVLLIELGTWINFSLSTIFGQSLNFLAYIVVGAIQLGATVDYAILVTNTYRALVKEGKDSLTAAYEAGTESTMSILTSAAIMVVACASVCIISSNAVIQEVTQMVMRGAVISSILVLFVLPSILACMSRLSQRAKEEGGMHKLTHKFISSTNDQILYATREGKAKKRVRKEKLIRKDCEALENLQCRGVLLLQPKKGYRFNSDSVILANLADVHDGDKVADFGTGSGILSFILAAKKNATVSAIEIQPTLADMAKRSVKLNSLEDRIDVIEGDIKDAATLIGNGTMDAVICNPPYYKAGSGAVCEDEMQAIARHEVKITLTDIISSAAKVLKMGGKLNIIIPTDREKELDKLIAKSELETYSKIRLTSSEQKTPETVIFFAAKRGNVTAKGIVDAEENAPDSAIAAVTERVLVTKKENGEMSDEVLALYRS